MKKQVAPPAAGTVDGDWGNVGLQIDLQRRWDRRPAAVRARYAADPPREVELALGAVRAMVAGGVHQLGVGERGLAVAPDARLD